jgi:hypothetical protein
MTSDTTSHRYPRGRPKKTDPPRPPKPPKTFKRDQVQPGQIYNLLTVIAIPSKLDALCQCQCGQTVLRRRASLLRDICVSCGCKRKAFFEGHGLHHVPEYRVWLGMKQRCLNPKHNSYPHYGGRGITIHPTWIASFAAFYADLPPRPSPKHTLGRIDNDGPYAPGNVRWETLKEQRRNTRVNRLLTIHGVTKPLIVWAEEVGVPRSTIEGRLRNRWTEEQAVFGRGR